MTMAIGRSSVAAVTRPAREDVVQQGSRGRRECIENASPNHPRQEALPLHTQVPLCPSRPLLLVLIFYWLPLNLLEKSSWMTGTIGSIFLLIDSDDYWVDDICM